MTPERKHGGCHDCGSPEQEILTSRPDYAQKVPMSLALCDPCAEIHDRRRARTQRLNERLAAS